VRVLTDLIHLSGLYFLGIFLMDCSMRVYFFGEINCSCLGNQNT
jgi:hypothetical protein